ncbi:hypothetical protein AO380_1937 [Moraxella catarrhalis]|nr:hypothetical protein AO380_1937 [Moraxella catarrhalis]
MDHILLWQLGWFCSLVSTYRHMLVSDKNILSNLLSLI